MNQPRRQALQSSAIVLFAGALLLTAFASRADDADGVPKATAAARAWLALTDSGKYGASWGAAATVFQGAVTKESWEKALVSVRTPLGAVRSRKLKSATFTHELPRAPKGDYVVVEYDTEFENRPGAVETVTPMLEKDGSWKVSGYYIK
ncbi:MAG: DUF4019 domain-containing protein [Acidobacteriota bacterium]|nr:DUF4019 domain-containing protein [Acidobacteriota bacterium]